MDETIAKVMQSYDLGKEIKIIHEIAHGRINRTFKITTPNGIFILQRLNKVFKKELMEDQSALLPFLQKNGISTCQLRKTTTGKPYVLFEENIWRLQEFIQHEREQKSGDSIAKVAKLLAKFHKIGKTTSYKPKCTIPDFHNTPKIIEKLKRVYLDHLAEAKLVQKEYEFIISEQPFPKYIVPELDKTLIHGDPKFSNFLFHDNEIVAIVDMDTMMWENPLLDLGDALRNWCRNIRAFVPENFNLAVDAYTKEFPNVTVDMCKRALLLITLELAARFLTDYFEQSYFNWDKKNFSSAAESHLFRTRELLAYYKNIVDYFDQK